MEKSLIRSLNVSFEGASNEQDGVEFWYARDLQGLLEYDEWRNFSKVIEKAKLACGNAGLDAGDHFVEVNKMVPIGSGTERSVPDVMLTRYACYLIAQNGDPKKDSVAFAQAYFAVQTRKQEILEERLAMADRLSARKKLVETETELSRVIYERGVDEKGFGRIRSKGDAALFGGNTTQSMKKKLGVPEGRPLADFLPTITIKAKDLATEMTNFNVVKDALQGEPEITDEHVRNNKDVRGVLTKRGIKPEGLPPEEDIKKLEKRVKKSDEKSLGENAALKKPKA